MTRLKTYLISALQLALTPLFQVLALILTSHALGAADFGAFSVVQASTLILSELAGLGASELMIRRISVDKTDARDALGASLKILATSTPPSLILYGASIYYFSKYGSSSEIFFGHSLIFAAIFGVTEIVAGKIIVNVEHLSIATNRITLANTCRAIVPLFRLLILLTTYALNLKLELPQIFAIYSLSMIIGLGTISTIALYTFGIPNLSTTPPPIKEGLGFCANQLIRSLQGNADRIVLNMWLPASSIGAYVVAIRVIQMAVLPITAVLRASYPGMFEAGSKGVFASVRYARSIAPSMIASTTIAVAAALAFAPTAPLVLGSDFNGVTPIAYALSLTPIFIAFGYVAGDILTGLGQQRYRVTILILSSFLQYVFIFATSKPLGSYAAVFGTYAFNISFAALASLLVFRSYKREAKNERKP